MTVEYLKKAPLHSHSDATEKREIVRIILYENEAGGDAKALEYAAKFYNYEGEIILTDEAIAAASEFVPEKMKCDIEFAHANVKKIVVAQTCTVSDFEIEEVPGLIAGQKAIPVNAAGGYIPGGQCSHIASAIMTVTTAKVVGGNNTFACSPPHILQQNRYIEHGTFYSIFVLAVIMFLQIITSVPELITGLMSATIIGFALYSSIRHNKRE